METSRREQKKLEMRQRIISKTVDLIEASSYVAVSMEQIAREVDIAKGTLYNYFSDKEAIVCEYVQEVFRDRLQERVVSLKHLPNTRERGKWLMLELMSGVKRSKDLFEHYLLHQMRSMVSLNAQSAEPTGLGRTVYELISIGIKEGGIRGDLPIEIHCEHYIFAFIQVVKVYYKDPSSFETSTIVDDCVDMFLKGSGDKKDEY